MQIRATASGLVSQLLCSGGDARIAVRPGAGSNIYGTTPYPRENLAYASSTANDISAAAYAHLQAFVQPWLSGGEPGYDAYGLHMENLRSRIRTVYRLSEATDVIFAPSGTDLEYVALARERSTRAEAITNVLLGVNEVGRGCVHSAGGRYFAAETAHLERAAVGQVIDGLEDIATVDVPIRDRQGGVVGHFALLETIRREVQAALLAGRRPIVHVLHGSKTGLIAPDLEGVDALRQEFGDAVSFAVDACQGRIEPETVAAYLDRRATVLLTGSKFVGGPPFAGFALVPGPHGPRYALPKGLATIFSGADWPSTWPGASQLPQVVNAGLLLRLEAAAFELERFSALDPARRSDVIAAFVGAVEALAQALDVPIIRTAQSGGPLLATLATLNVAALPGAPDIDLAQRWRQMLAARGVRLGQPVKCARLPDGRWAGTLRIGLSMPLIVGLSQFGDRGKARLESDMAAIAEMLRSVSRAAA